MPRRNYFCGTAEKRRRPLQVNLADYSSRQDLKGAPPPIDWLLQDSFPRHELGIILAPPGTGKGFFALQLALDLASAIAPFGIWESTGKPARVHEFLSTIYDTKGGHVANKYRKHLLAAWNWGLKTMDDFPSGPSPLLNIPPFQVESKDRYVPPDEDINAVLAQAKGQDLVMLTTYIYTGARKQELFRLRWEDVDLEKMRLRLTDRKGGSGKPRVRW